jgi:hypothetical protein
MSIVSSTLVPRPSAVRRARTEIVVFFKGSSLRERI